MAAKTTTKKNSLLVRAEARIKGIEANKFGGSDTLMIAGTSFDVDTGTARIQAVAGTIEGADAARTAARTAVAKKKAEAPGDRQFLKDFDDALIQQVGRDPVVLAEYGITLPAPRAKPKATSVVTGNAKRAQTRTKRGIMGPKARAAIGVVKPVVTVHGPDGEVLSPAPAPATALALPAVNAAPAPAAPAAAPADPVAK